jgi:hypothetical protein
MKAGRPEAAFAAAGLDLTHPSSPPAAPASRRRSWRWRWRAWAARTWRSTTLLDRVGRLEDTPVRPMTIRQATPGLSSEAPAIELGAEAFRGMDVLQEVFEQASPSTAGSCCRPPARCGWPTTPRACGLPRRDAHGERLHRRVRRAADRKARDRGGGCSPTSSTSRRGPDSLSLTTFTVPWNGPFYRSCVSRPGRRISRQMSPRRWPTSLTRPHRPLRHAPHP